MHICRVATVPFMLHNHLSKQILATVEAGHQVTLISSDGVEVEDLKKIPGIQYCLIEIPRKISPLKDLIALFKLTLLFKNSSFDVVHSVTPKAGLLCAIAGFIARIPTRLHTYTGQPWVEMKGLVKYISINCDKLISKLNTHCYADSPSQAQFLVSNNIIRADKISVIGKGSVAGVDLQRFNCERWKLQSAPLLAELGLNKSCQVITFIGRITEDKGIFELLKAFNTVQSRSPHLVLLLVGPLEVNMDNWPLDVLKIIQHNSSIKRIGYARQPEKYLAISDVLCLPSYREGFGGVVIEAAAMKVPSIGTRIVGLTDAIIDNQTGLLVDVKNVGALSDAIDRIFNEEGLREHLAEQAYQRVITSFDSEKINLQVVHEYLKYKSV